MALLINLVVPFLTGAIIFLIVGWFTGSKEFGGVETNDDERSILIKQKATGGSWTFMLGLFIFSVVYDFFDLSKGALKNVPFAHEHPSLIYLIILVVSYFVFYWIYSRRLSSNEK